MTKSLWTRRIDDAAKPVQEKTGERPMTAQENYDLAARRELFPSKSRGRAKPAEKQE